MRKKNVTAYEHYLWWLARRKDLVKNLKAVKAAIDNDGLHETHLKNIEVPMVANAIGSARDEIDQLVRNAEAYAANLSCSELLSWMGPWGSVSHIATRCRIAAEDYVAELRNGSDPRRLNLLCVPLSRLFQKKMHGVGKVNIACGIVNGMGHVWCERNGVAVDLTRTQYNVNEDRVFVMPDSLYPCDKRVTGDNVFINDETVAQIEKYYTCESFVKRKSKRTLVE